MVPNTAGFVALGPGDVLTTGQMHNARVANLEDAKNAVGACPGGNGRPRKTGGVDDVAASSTDGMAHTRPCVLRNITHHLTASGHGDSSNHSEALHFPPDSVKAEEQ
ncbi:hypothetical protein ACKVV7_011439 [Pyricularia oryzae]